MKAYVTRESGALVHSVTHRVGIWKGGGAKSDHSTGAPTLILPIHIPPQNHAHKENGEQQQVWYVVNNLGEVLHLTRVTNGAQHRSAIEGRRATPVLPPYRSPGTCFIGPRSTIRGMSRELTSLSAAAAFWRMSFSAPLFSSASCPLSLTTMEGGRGGGLSSDFKTVVVARGGREV